MKISYSMLTHNETDSLLKLIEFIVKHKDEEDEIVILDDYSGNEKTREILDTMCSIHEIKFEQRHLLKDYAGQKKWAREYEVKLEKGLFEDLSHANAITLKEVLQQYCSEVSSTKLGYAEEKYKIKKLCRETIANLKLAKITPLRLKKFQDSWSLNHNPSTVNKYLTLISVAIKHARQMLGIYLPNNPCDFVKRLKEPEFEGEIIDEHEEELLLTA